MLRSLSTLRWLPLLLLVPATATLRAQTPIATVRTQPLGSIQTVTGVATTGPEFGNLRFLQDATAGIAIYEVGALGGVNTGDSLTVTGELADFNQLLELVNLTVINHGPAASPPQPIVLSPPVAFGEAYESQLVQVEPLTFADAGGTFALFATNYTVLNGGNAYTVRLPVATDLLGSPIPSGAMSVTGIMAQFSPSDPASGYQLQPRTIPDLAPYTPPVGSNVVTSTANSGTGSLRDVIAGAMAGATISFDPSLYGDSIILSGPILLDKDLVIDGPGRSLLTVSGGGSQRVFSIATGATVEIRGLRIRRGNSAILNDGELTIRDCLFDRNVTSQVGGAIRDENILRVYDSEFRGNAVTGSGSVFDGGGAIYSELDSLVLVRCSFRNNSAADPSGGPVSGGAVWAVSATSGVRLEDCVFENNHVALSGSSWFPAAYYGGGALSSSARLRVSNSLFTDNGISGNSLYGGGAVFVSNTSTFDDCTFSRNTATGTLTFSSSQGGALFGESTANYTLEINRCHFQDNQVSSGTFSYGGALVFDSPSGSPLATMNVSDCRFTGNTAGLCGGAVFVDDSDFSLIRCTLDSNSAGNPAGTGSFTQGGGGLYFDGGSAAANGLVDRCTFSGNTGVELGGAILYSNSSTLQILRSTLVQNRAIPKAGSTTATGGAIYLFCGGANLTVSNNVLSNNIAASVADVFVPSSCGSSGSSNGHNLWGTVSGALASAATDITGVFDPQLGGLADNGGSLPTHAPLCQSPVLNAGNPADLTPDQSAQAVVGSARDIGAHEARVFPVEGFQAGNMSSPLEFDWNPYCNPPAIDGYRLLRRAETTAFLDIPNPLTLDGQDPAAGTFLHPGFFETYRIVAYAGTDVSEERKALGRVRPNGRIQGNVRTQSGGPISGVQVCAQPSASRSLSLDGVDDHVRTERALPLGPKGSLSVFVHADDWGASGARGIAGNDLPATANGAVGLDYDAATGLSFRYGGTSQTGSRVLTWTDTATVAGWHHVAAAWATDAGVTRLVLYWDGRPVAETTTTLSLAGSAHWNVGRNGDGQYWEGRLDEFQVRSDAIDSVWAADSAGIIPEASLLEYLDLYWRFETEAQTSGSTLVVDYAKDGLNHVPLRNGAVLSVDAGYPMRYCAETGTGPNAGKYSIDEVYYAKGAGSSFTVFPVSEDRFYDPAQQNASLDVGDPTQTGVDFTDTTSFSVEGFVTLEGNSALNIPCSLDSVKIQVSGPVPLIPDFVYTDENGFFSAAVPEEGNWTFTPLPEGRYENHGFVPSSRVYAVNDDVIGADFEDTTTYRLVGDFRGGCENFFTDYVALQITARTPHGDCINFLDTLAGNSWNLRLPPFRYSVKIADAFVGGVADFGITNRLDILGRRSVDADLRFGADTTYLRYKAPPVLSVDTVGVPTENLAGCSTVVNRYRVLEQAKVYPVPMRVEETYTDGTTCAFRADSLATVFVNDPIGGNSGTYTMDSLSRIVFPLAAVNVNTLPGSSVPPFSLPFGATASLDGESSNAFAVRYVITGFRSDSNSNVTISPQLPFYVLRDPPGDGSFATLLKDSTYCRSIGLSSKKSATDDFVIDNKLGAKFETISGFGVSIGIESEVWVTQSGEYVSTSANTSAESLEECFTRSTQYSTSSDEAFVGPDADVFIGGAYVWTYALSDEVFYNESTCSMDVDRTIAFAPDSVTSTYTLTRSQIENQVIPDLEELIARQPLDPVTGGPNDTARGLINQLDVWRQVLANTDAVADSVLAEGPVENVTFSGGTVQTQSTTTSTSDQLSVSYDLEIDDIIAVSAGYDVGGSGSSFGYRFTSNYQDIEDTLTTTTVSQTVAYTLTDDDPGDLFSVDIATDPVFQTPIFRLIGGQSSCPYEPGAVQRDDVQLVTASTFQFVPAPLTAAEFNLTVSNASFSLSDVSRSFKIQAGDNFDNATITAFGGNLATAVPFTLDNGETINFVVRVQRPGDPASYEYNDLRIAIFPDCGTIADALAEVTLTAHFESPCGEPTLAKPADGWLVNAASNDKLAFTLTDYAGGNIDTVVFQYRLLPFGLWTDFDGVGGSALAAAASTVPPDLFYDLDWNVGSIVDGDYEVRAKTVCPTGVVYTNYFSGTIDRESLQPVSTVPPDGGTLAFGQTPSITYNEELFCGTAGPLNTTAVFDADGSLVGLEDPICGGATLTTPFRFPITSECELENEWVTITVADLIDQFGNEVPESSWSFYVDRFADPALGLSGTGPSAEGGSDGSVDLTVSGGFPPYTFLWSNGATSEDLSGLPAGTYAVTVTDSKCSFVTDSVTIEDPGTVPPPANDLCTAADTLAPGSYAITTLGATGTDISSCGVNDTADVWFYYIPTRSGTAIVSTCGSDFDPVITVRPSCTGGTEFGCNDNDVAGLRCGGNEAAIELPVVAGVGAYIRLSGANGSVGQTTLTIEEPVSACSSATPPQNPRHAVEASRVRLEWDPIAGSVACEVRGERLVPSPVNGKATINAPEASFTNVPFTALGAGTTWRFRVRCACSITPTVDATGYSAYDTFSVPAARDVIDPQELRAVSVFPNPARETLHVDLQGYADTDVDLRVIDASGRMVLARRLAVGRDWAVEPLDLSDLPAGAYSLTVTDRTGSRSLRFVHLE